MKPKPYLVLAILLLTIRFAHGQGTFIYDQQSINLIEGSADLKLSQPLGQSFTPTFSTVGFVQFNLYDGDVLHSSGATALVYLRSDSIAGPILGSSAPVFMPDGFFDITSFFFPTPVAVVPGTTYYLQPVIQSGDSMGSGVTDGSYAGGIAIFQGVPIPDRDLWFREGIFVPEPSSLTFLFIGGAIGVWRVRRKPNSK